MESIITQKCIILTEIEDYRHEYLRLWMSGFLQWPQVTILNEWSQQWSQHPDSLRDVVNNNSKFTNIHWVRGFRHEYPRLWLSGVFNDHKFTVLNEWSQQWSQHPDSLRDIVNNNSKLNNIDWVRGLQARLSTIMNEWFLQWPQVYNFEWVESTIFPASTLSKGCSK